MARRSMQKRPSKLKPIERTFHFDIPTGTSYVDSGFVLAFMNRQMMKQGMEYVIESIELFGASGTDASVIVQSLSKNWVSSNSWVKGFSHWKEQQDEFLREAGQESRKAAYNDFKIYYDIDHSFHYFLRILLPLPEPLLLTPWSDMLGYILKLLFQTMVVLLAIPMSTVCR